MEDYIFENNKELECSSGCDSGWTSYLQHSPDSQTDHYYYSAGQLGFGEVNRSKQLLGHHEVVMSEEDMSMVSDASSGPAHHYNLHHQEQVNNAATNNDIDDDDNNNNVCNFSYDFVSATANSFDWSENKKKSKQEKRRRRKVVVVQDHPSSLLDDTASSPCLDFSNNNEISYGVSSFRSCNILEENNVTSEYSQGYSTTHYKVRPEHSVHYDYFKSGTGNIQMEQNQWF